jgi:hypothetical protein
VMGGGGGGEEGGRFGVSGVSPPSRVGRRVVDYNYGPVRDTGGEEFDDSD